MMSWIHSLIFWRKGLYPFERKTVLAVAEKLPAVERRRIELQIAAINLVQRHSKGKEVNLYHRDKGRTDFDENLRFQGLPEELKLGIVQISNGNSPKPLRVEVFVVNGRLFSLVFSRPPIEFFATKDLESVDPVITHVNVCADLAPSSHSNVAWSPASKELEEWLGVLYNASPSAELKPPLPADIVENHIDQIDAALPQDFLELTKWSNGFRVGQAVVYGVSEVRLVAHDQSNFYVLAELGTSIVICVKQGSRDALVYDINVIDDEVCCVGPFFKEALQRHADMLKV